ncbi:hypothetical protein DPMN_037827 [Dreissena polymorpha]|uniref:Uncharacterized protein n=1 Tax=Dreissena polymorpha TaxID=45954 RepID=A0A9D4MC17_DREPO|nr:hypothetical protein DPMN_037827 [Dreissena polymorpha]
MVSMQGDVNANEAQIYMPNIVHAKELIEREEKSSLWYQKTIYRYCDKVHTPFTIAAMGNQESQPSDTSTAVFPDGLRKINTELIHERASKSLIFQLFSEWVNSGFIIGRGITDAFLIENK